MNAIEELQEVAKLTAQALRDMGEEIDHMQEQLTAQSTALRAIIDMNHMIAEELGWMK